MNKKTQAVLTICVDISMLAVTIAASYLLLTGRVQGALQIAAQAAVILAIPTMFFLTFLTFGTSRYEKLDMEDEETPEEEDILIEPDTPIETEVQSGSDLPADTDTDIQKTNPK